jgi:hypothetical protein
MGMGKQSEKFWHGRKKEGQHFRKSANTYLIFIKESMNYSKCFIVAIQMYCDDLGVRVDDTHPKGPWLESPLEQFHLVLL